MPFIPSKEDRQRWRQEDAVRALGRFGSIGPSTAPQAQDAQSASAEETPRPRGDETPTKTVASRLTRSGFRTALFCASLMAWSWCMMTTSGRSNDFLIAVSVAVTLTCVLLVELMRK